MAFVKLLKVHTTGISTEMASNADSIELQSFKIEGTNILLSASGLDVQNTNIGNVGTLDFNDPSVGTISQTVGAVIVDDLMAVDRENTMLNTGSVAFGAISNVAGEVDSFKVPQIVVNPTAIPTNGGSGHLVFNDTTNSLFIFNGTSWVPFTASTRPNELVNSYVASENLAIRDVLYIDQNDGVARALATADSTAQAIGFADAAVSAASPITVKSQGIVSGFTGLVAGERQFLSATVAGGIQNTVPTGSGHVILSVGFAKNATDLQIQVQSLGRRF